MGSSGGGKNVQLAGEGSKGEKKGKRKREGPDLTKKEGEGHKFPLKEGFSWGKKRGGERKNGEGTQIPQKKEKEKSLVEGREKGDGVFEGRGKGVTASHTLTREKKGGSFPFYEKGKKGGLVRRERRQADGVWLRKRKRGTGAGQTRFGGGNRTSRSTWKREKKKKRSPLKKKRGKKKGENYIGRGKEDIKKEPPKVPRGGRS